jgi:hypothetical protein
MTDSSLTVCFINGTVILKTSPDENYNVFRGIAQPIKHALQKPESYRSYNIIFVKRDTLCDLIGSAHTAGAVVSSKGL